MKKNIDYGVTKHFLAVDCSVYFLFRVYKQAGVPLLGKLWT